MKHLINIIKHVPYNNKIIKWKRTLFILLLGVGGALLCVFGMIFYLAVKQPDNSGSPYDRTWGKEKKVILKADQNASASDLLDEVTAYVFEWENTEIIRNVTARINVKNNKVKRFIIDYEAESLDGYTGVLEVYCALSENQWRIESGIVRYDDFEKSETQLKREEVQTILDKGLDCMKDRKYLIESEFEFCISEDRLNIQVHLPQESPQVVDGPLFMIDKSNGEIILKELK